MYGLLNSYYTIVNTVGRQEIVALRTGLGDWAVIPTPIRNLMYFNNYMYFFCNIFRIIYKVKNNIH